MKRVTALAMKMKKTQLPKATQLSLAINLPSLESHSLSTSTWAKSHTIQLVANVVKLMALLPFQPAILSSVGLPLLCKVPKIKVISRLL
jgi:hypothetical protein